MLTIRTIDMELAKYFKNVCVNNYTTEIKGLIADIRILPKKMLETVYTLTPLIVKTHEGYWRAAMDLSEWEERVKVNLIKNGTGSIMKRLMKILTCILPLSLKTKFPLL